MPILAHLTPLDPRYPSRLRGLDEAPASVTVGGGPIEATQTVAIVGSREPTGGARRFAGDLAAALAAAGIVVVSGGALGIDTAAHRGALRVGGRTWAIAPTGHERCFPPENEELFDTIAAGPGAMIWPFGPTHAHRSAFLVRNRYLVGLSDAVVVVQAGLASGALHAASCARRMNKPLWVVPAAPWLKRFGGSVLLLEGGALPLASSEPLFRSLGLHGRNRTHPKGSRERPWFPAPSGPLRQLSEQEFKTLGATSSEPRHTDAIAEGAGMSPQAAIAALLTLALENVVVEGPPGFFRRRDSHNH